MLSVLASSKTTTGICYAFGHDSPFFEAGVTVDLYCPRELMGYLGVPPANRCTCNVSHE